MEHPPPLPEDVPIQATSLEDDSGATMEPKGLVSVSAYAETGLYALSLGGAVGGSATVGNHVGPQLRIEGSAICAGPYQPHAGVSGAAEATVHIGKRVFHMGLKARVETFHYWSYDYVEVQDMGDLLISMGGGGPRGSHWGVAFGPELMLAERSNLYPSGALQFSYLHRSGWYASAHVAPWRLTLAVGHEWSLL